MIPTVPGATFIVRIKPGASTTEVVSEDPLIIRVAAPPVEGKANRELLTFLKKTRGIRCSILSGETSRTKKLLVIRGEA